MRRCHRAISTTCKEKKTASTFYDCSNTMNGNRRKQCRERVPCNTAPAWTHSKFVVVFAEEGMVFWWHAMVAGRREQNQSLYGPRAKTINYAQVCVNENKKQCNTELYTKRNSWLPLNTHARQSHQCGAPSSCLSRGYSCGGWKKPLFSGGLHSINVGRLLIIKDACCAQLSRTLFDGSSFSSDESFMFRIRL